MIELHPILSLTGVPGYVTYSWLAMAVLIVSALAIRKSLQIVPTGMQNVLEAAVEGLYGFCRDNVGHKWVDTFFPFLGTLFLYIFVCNFFGLVPGFVAPTENINTTASCAIPVFLLTHYYGIKVKKFHYIDDFLGPMRSIYALPLMVLMFFIEIISHLARPITLTVRLFGNMLSHFYLAAVTLSQTPLFMPVIILGLGTLVSAVQAFVFLLLSTLYLAGAVSEEGH